MRAFIISAALVATACGGAQPTTKREMNKMAADAPPPPSVKAGGQVVERKVSREAKTDFAAAVKFFQDAGADGKWTIEECSGSAAKFEAVASEHDKMVEAHYNAGVAYQMCSDMQKAEAAYQKALRINPSHAPSLANLGEIYYRGGNVQRAQQYFENAVKADGFIVAARVNLGWIYYTKMREDRSNASKYESEAMGQLQRALAVDNDNVVAFTVMALIFMEGSEKNRNRLDVAKLLLDRGKEKNDKYAPLYNAVGLLAMRRSNVAKALEAFRTAVALDPKFIEARMNLAQAVLSFRKYDEAETLFREVLTLKPTKEVKYKATVGLGVAVRGLATVFRAQGAAADFEAKIQEAESQYRAAVELDPKRSDAYFNLGLLYKDFKTDSTELKENKKSYEEARKYFQEFVSKGSSEKDKVQEAKDHIEDCDKYIQILNQAIAAQASAPPPAPTPAPGPPKNP